jgi:hypothetical protein
LLIVTDEESQIAKAVREAGNKLWKEGKAVEALDKWQSRFS